MSDRDSGDDVRSLFAHLGLNPGGYKAADKPKSNRDETIAPEADDRDDEPSIEDLTTDAKPPRVSAPEDAEQVKAPQAPATDSTEADVSADSPTDSPDVDSSNSTNAADRSSDDDDAATEQSAPSKGQAAVADDTDNAPAEDAADAWPRDDRVARGASDWALFTDLDRDVDADADADAGAGQTYETTADIDDEIEPDPLDQWPNIDLSAPAAPAAERPAGDAADAAASRANKLFARPARKAAPADSPAEEPAEAAAQAVDTETPAASTKQAGKAAGTVTPADEDRVPEVSMRWPTADAAAATDEPPAREAPADAPDAPDAPRDSHPLRGILSRLSQATEARDPDAEAPRLSLSVPQRELFKQDQDARQPISSLFARLRRTRIESGE